MLLVVLYVLFATGVQGSHFRYGTISWWIADPAKPNVVTFRVSTAWRTSFFGVNVGDQFNPGEICFRNGSKCYDMVSVVQSQFKDDGSFSLLV